MPRVFKVPCSTKTAALFDRLDSGDDEPEVKAAIQASIAEDEANGQWEECTPAQAEYYRTLGLLVED